MPWRIAKPVLGMTTQLTIGGSTESGLGIKWGYFSLYVYGAKLSNKCTYRGPIKWSISWEELTVMVYVLYHDTIVLWNIISQFFNPLCFPIKNTSFSLCMFQKNVGSLNGLWQCNGSTWTALSFKFGTGPERFTSDCASHSLRKFRRKLLDKNDVSYYSITKHLRLGMETNTKLLILLTFYP